MFSHNYLNTVTKKHIIKDFISKKYNIDLFRVMIISSKYKNKLNFNFNINIDIKEFYEYVNNANTIDNNSFYAINIDLIIKLSFIKDMINYIFRNKINVLNRIKKLSYYKKLELVSNYENNIYFLGDYTLYELLLFARHN